MKTKHILKTAGLISAFSLSSIALVSCDDDNSSSNNNNSSEVVEDVAIFYSATLPGIYEITFAGEAGVHVYEFKADGTVDIVYGDGITETEDWMVNDDGALVITGSVDDLFTLTSGDQSSGNMDVILRDALGEEERVDTTGTILKQ